VDSKGHTDKLGLTKIWEKKPTLKEERSKEGIVA
jgi:hypothetical protein